MLNQSSQFKFAPLYNRRQRWRILLKTLLVVTVIAAVLWVFLLPWFTSFLPTAHCQTILGINGLTFMLMIMYVVWPILLLLFLMFTEGPKSWRVYQLKQTPLPGEYVMKPTRFQYGNRALIRPIGFLVTVVLLLFISLGAAYVVYQFSQQVSERTQNCQQTISLKS